MTLRIYNECVQMVRDVAPIVRAIDKHDPDLAQQARRAAASVVLNTAEGAYSLRGHQRARWGTARGSAAETRAIIDVALALEYVAKVDPAVLDRLDKIIATLSKLTR
jgi:four helix bundle protein